MASPVVAYAVETSGNVKLGPVSATYVSQHSCPTSCPLRGAGCYAEHGPLSFHTRRLNRAGRRTPKALAREEAAAIDGLTGDRPLRLHVVGDARTAAAARVLAAAARRYRQRGGRPVWTYTHAWREVARAEWGGVSVLASCEDVRQARAAMARGYAAACVVAGFRREGAYEECGVKLLPCPNQTRGVQCRDCGLCMDDGRLLAAGLVIAFKVHGQGRRHALQVLGGRP